MKNLFLGYEFLTSQIYLWNFGIWLDSWMLVLAIYGDIILYGYIKDIILLREGFQVYYRWWKYYYYVYTNLEYYLTYATVRSIFSVFPLYIFMLRVIDALLHARLDILISNWISYFADFRDTKKNWFSNWKSFVGTSHFHPYVSDWPDHYIITWTPKLFGKSYSVLNRSITTKGILIIKNTWRPYCESIVSSEETSTLREILAKEGTLPSYTLKETTEHGQKPLRKYLVSSWMLTFHSRG